MTNHINDKMTNGDGSKKYEAKSKMCFCAHKIALRWLNKQLSIHH